MDDISRIYEETTTGPTREPDDRDRVHCEECRNVFIVEHVGQSDSWVCPQCEKPHINLHRHFVLLGAATALLIVGALAILVLYLVLNPDVGGTVPYIIWSAVQFSVASYVALAVFGDQRAYGLAALRVLMPLALLMLGAFILVMGHALWSFLLLIPVGLVLAGIYAYTVWVFLHAFRMAEMHRPRESVVRPMYTLISVTLHVILLTMFAIFLMPEQRRTPGTSSVEFGRPGGYVPTEQQIEELEEIEEVEPEEEEIDPDIEIEEIEIEVEFETDMIIRKLEPEERPPIRKVQRKVAKKYEQRYDRQFALINGGGSDRTEWAVLCALRWLKAHQNADGSWGEEPLQPSMTGLALLCFLGHGEDHFSEEFGGTVRGALEWLKGHQDAEGYLAHEPDMRFAYQHGIATYALAEAYAMTGLEPLKPVVTDAVKVILHGQTDQGGWYYGYTKGGITVRDYKTGQEFYKGDWPGGDTSVSAWQIQALTAAWFAGIEFPNRALSHARRKALNDIKSRINTQEGWSGYQDTSARAPYPEDDTESAREAATYALTGAATLCLQFLGAGESPEAKSMLTTMRRFAFNWHRTKGGWHDAPLYAWYYITQAKFHAAAPRPKDNAAWMYWNNQMTATLIKEQHQDGSWGFPDLSMEGKELVPGTTNKPVYATTMCCLMLEVYYRYLPTYNIR